MVVVVGTAVAIGMYVAAAAVVCAIGGRDAATVGGGRGVTAVVVGGV